MSFFSFFKHRWILLFKAKNGQKNSIKCKILSFFPDQQPVTLCILPLYHIYALNVTMTPTLWSGGQLVMLPKFEPKTFIQALEQYKPNFLHLAPPLLAFCADNAGVRPESLERLHHIMTAAAPTGPTLLRRFKKKAPSVILKEGKSIKLD